MNNKAYFYIRNGELRCRFESLDKIKTFREDQAVELLKEIDKNELSIRVKNDKVILTSEKENLNVEITKDIFDSKYKFLARKTYKRLKRLAKEYMLEKYKNKNIKKTLVRGSLIAAGPLAAIIIGMNLDKPEKATELDKQVVELEFNVDEAELYIERIPTDDNTYLAKYEEEIPKVQEATFVNDTEPYIEMLIDSNVKTQEILQGTAEIPTTDHSQDEDVIALRDRYMNEAIRAQERWGIDARLLLAMLTQESHGRHTNLMQIQFGSFNDEIMRVYNFEEEREMKVVFTNSPQKYAGKVDMTISEEEMKNPAVQIKLAAMIMNYNNYNSSYTNINVSSMLIMYNQGPVGGKKILDATPGTRESILGDPENTDLINYTYITETGDPEYVQNVTQYLDQTDGPIRVYSFAIDEDGNKHPVCVYYTVDKILDNTVKLY